MAVLTCCFLFSSSAIAQVFCKYDTAIQNAQRTSAGAVLRAANGAQVTVCPAFSAGTPCAPKSSLFDKNGVAINNPVIADVNGNYGFCVNTPGRYMIQIGGTGFTTFVQDNSIMPNDPNSPVFTNAIITGGILIGTFSGNPTFSGTPIFSNSPTFPDPLALTGSLSLLSTKDIRWNADTFIKRGPGSGFVSVGTTSGGVDGTVTTGTFNANVGYQISGAATSGRYLKGNGTSFVVSTGSASGVGSPTACTNQAVTALTLNSDAAPTSTCSTITPSFATGNTTGSGNFVLQTGGTLSGPVINGTPTGTGIQTLTLKQGSAAGNYTTANTTYTVVDSTNLCYTVTIPTGWKLAVTAVWDAFVNTAAVAINFALTDNAACTTANAGILQQTGQTPATVGNGNSMALAWVINGDGASHNIALQYKTSNGADSVGIVNGASGFVPSIIFVLSPSQ